MKKRKNNKKILILSLLLILFLTITATQAAEIQDNTTQSDSTVLSSQEDVINGDTQISVSQNNKLSLGEKTFTDLDELINSTTGDRLEITDDYKYVNSDDDNGIIISKDNLVINGNGHTIDADEQSKVFIITGHNVTLKNIKIKNGYFDKTYTINNFDSITAYHSPIIWSGHNGTMENVEIKDCAGRVTINYAPDYYTGTVNIIGSTALFWTGANGTITNTIFTGNTKLNGGSNTISGALRITGVNSTIKNSKFTNNNGYSGSGIYAAAYNTTVINSEFTNNTGYVGGGIYSVGHIKIIDSTFNNIATSNAGAAIYITGGNATIINSIISKNRGYVAAVDIVKSDVEIIDCIFSDNYATEQSGALQIGTHTTQTISNVTVKNCKFSNNTAFNQYPTLCIGGKENCNIVNCDFANVTTNNPRYGVLHGTNINVINSTFSNITGCQAVDMSHDSNMINCSFKNINNTYNNNGYGILFIGKGDNRVINIINCIFANTTSTRGTIAIDENITTSISKCNLINSSGFRVAKNSNVNIYDCYLKNSILYAPKNADITSDNTNVIFTNITVINTTTANNLKGVSKIYNSTFIGSPGAAIKIYGDVYNSTFIDNNRGIEVMKNNCSIISCVFINNGPNCAIYTSNSIINTTIKYNAFINATANGKNGIISNKGIIESNWFGTNTPTYKIGSSYLVAELVKTEGNYLVGGEWNPIIKIKFYNNGTNEVINETASRQVKYTINKTGTLQFNWIDSKNSGKIFADNNIKQKFNISAKIDNQYLGILTFDGNNYTLSNTNSFKDLQILINASQPGETLTLNKDYTYNNVFVTDEPDIIVINKKLKIKGNIIISGADKTSIFNILADNVELEGLTFTNAKSTGDGGAIILTGNNAKLTNVKFTNNEATGNGGAIYAIGNNTQINNALFTNNIAQDGSAAYINGDNGILTNSIFNKNTARLFTGSDVYIKGAKTVLDNITVSESKHNAITISGSNATTKYIILTNITGDALTITGDDNKITDINMTNVIGTGINTGKNSEISKINATGGNGTVIITKENSTITKINTLNHTGEVINGNGDNITVSDVNAINNIGDILKITGDNAKINNILAEGGEGTILYLKGDNGQINNVDGTNHIGETMKVIGEGTKYKNLSPVVDGVTDPLKIQTHPDTNSPTYTVEGLKSEANGFFTVYINGKIYGSVVVRNGKPLSNITVNNMTPGNYSVTLVFSPSEDTFKEISNNNTVVIAAPTPAPVITLTGINLNPLYSSLATYKVQVLSDGKAVENGTNVSITFNGKTTNATIINSYATLNLNTAIKIGTYTITAKYNDKSVNNTVIIQNIINANKLKKIKKSKKVTKVKVSLAKVDGKILSGKTLTLKIKGKKIATAKTNKKGVATFKIKKNKVKKLKSGKATATVTYGEDIVSKKIKITK